MKTVHEVSELSGVSIRTLHHYDTIGLLKPSARSEAGYRLYDDGDLARLQEILLFRELEFPLADIRGMLESPAYDRGRALAQQIGLLELKRDRLDGLIALAKELQAAEDPAVTEKELQAKGEVSVAFDAFDTAKLEEYKAAAKASWGATPEWREYEERSRSRGAKEERNMGEELMALFVPFGLLAAAGADPSGEEARAQAARIQDFISANFYTCTDEVFAQLGRTYGAGGDFTRNIDAAAGGGAASFASHAVEAYLAAKPSR